MFPQSTMRAEGLGENLFRRGSKRVKLFVFGAGVSREFGVPVSEYLLDSVVQWALANGQSGRAKQLTEFIEAFYHDVESRHGHLPPAEDVLTFLDAAGAYADIRANGV